MGSGAVPLRVLGGCWSGFYLALLRHKTREFALDHLPLAEIGNYCVHGVAAGVGR